MPIDLLAPQGGNEPVDLLADNPPASNPLRRFVADPLISGVKGAIGVPEAAVGLADMVSGGRAGKFLEDEVGFKPKEARNVLNEMYSPEQRAANEYVQQGDGFFDTLGRAIEKPSTIGHAVVEALPLSAGGGLVGRGLVKAAGVAPWVAGAAGEGVVGAGSAAEQIRQETEGGLTTPEQNAMAGLSGVGTGAFGAVGAKFAGSKLGQKLGIADIEASIAGGSVGQPASKGITGLAKRMAGGAVSEGIVEEGPQSAWEQAMQNLATGKPWFEGVGNATAMGILTGGAMGASFNALPRSEPAAPPPDENPMTRIAGLLPAPVPTGVSGADVVGIDTANQASMDKAEANAAKIYAERDAYEKTMRTVFPFGMPTITTPLQPIQEQINALTGVNANPALSGMEKIHYQQQLKKLLDMPVGVTNDANGLEIPLTMGDLLESQAQAEEILRAKATGGIEPVPVVGPISAAANTAIATGAADAAQPDAPPPAYPTGSQRQQVNYGDGGTGEIIIEHAEDGSFSVTSVWDKGSANKSTGGTYPAGTDVNVAVDSLVRKHGGYSPAPGKAEDAPAPNTPPATAPRSPEPENAPVPVLAHSVTVAADEHSAEVYKPLIERMIRNKRNAKELGFDIDGAIGKAKEAMNGKKQMPGSFRSLAAKAEKRGDKETAEVLRQVADLNDARKNPPKKAADVAPAPAAQQTSQGEDNGQEAPRQTTEEVLASSGVPAEQTGNDVLAAQKAIINEAAHEAATSPQNETPLPTEAQRDAGNYKKGHVTLHGLDISIENPQGSVRSGVDADGKPWENTLANHYGYIKRTEGNDGDHVDVFIGDHPESEQVFIVNQKHTKTGAFDEHKVLLGFNSLTEAKAGYANSYQKGWMLKGVIAVTPTTLDELKAWIARGDMGKPFSDAGKPVALPNATAPEHVDQGVDDRELGQIVREFNQYRDGMVENDERITHVFDAPEKNEITRLADKTKVYHKDHGWMTPAEAKEKIAEWKERALAQGDSANENGNAQRVVLSLFDLSGKWSQPWEEAGYQVFRFDIQADPEVGDVNNFSTSFFNDWFADFDGMDIYAVLAATPCTDFAVSGARHFAAKDKDGRTVSSIKLVHQTLRTIEYFKPAVWAIENPVGRIEKLGGLPPWRLSFDPNHLGDPYTKKTLLWGRFNSDLPIAPVEPTEGSKMHKLYGGKSMATKNARSETPEGFAYGFFLANNAVDNMAMALANKYDRLDRALIQQALDAGVTEEEINHAVEDFYYMELDDDAANQAIREAIEDKTPPPEEKKKTLPERVAEAKADSAEREKDEKGNPIYRKGERVEFTTGRNAGRHGTVSEALAMVSTTVEMFSGKTPRKSTSYYYQVQTDNGIEVSANAEEIAFETRPPESVVLDPVVDGRAIDPLVLHNSIGYARQSAENYRASAQRARKASAIAEHQRNAKVQDEKAAKAQEAWNEWAGKNPAEAEKITPSKRLPASPAARKEAEAGTTTTTADETLKGVGLVVAKGLTNNGKTVWNVSGNTKEHSAIIKAAGGRWYGPKKVWSFYNADPSAALAAKFSGQASAPVPNAPALASNEVQLPGSPYVYAKDAQGWTWRVGNGPAYNGRVNALKSDAPIINQLESLLAEKNPTINRTPTIDMSDAALEKVLVNAEMTPVEKDRAAAELEARDTADLPDIGAMFDEVLAEETAPEKPDPWKTVLVKANAFMTIDGVDYRVRNDFSQGNKDAGEPVSLRTSGMVAQVVEKPYAEVEAAIKANKEKVRKLPTPQVDAPTPTPKPRTASQAAGSAVVNAAKGTGDVFDALGALFGSKGSRLSMGLSFDEDTYRQAKPLFISAIAHFKDAAADLKEAIRAVIKEMNSRFSPEVTENMKPYVVRFFEDVRAGDIVYDEKNGEYKDGTQTTGATDHGTLPGIPAESVSTNESGGDSGNVRPEQSGSGAGSDGGTSEPGLSANGSVGSGAGGSVPRRRKPKQGSASDGGNLPAASSGQSHPVKSGLTDYVITDETRLGEGGAKTKFKNNLAAIRLITELDTSGRPVTRDDQDVLARYVGWGMLPQAFDATNKEWAAEFSELKGLLNEDEWNEAYMSTQYAHYTSEQIISNGIYAALERFGFSGGKILEPGSGVGNFVGLMPTSLRTAGSRVTGIERERISSKIGQYLYPTHNMLQADFTEFQSADGYFDAVAGNPPFAATALTDASGRKHLSGLSVHNYFFAKSVDLLRPGGVFAMVVSNSFLDGQKDNARRYIGERTRFLGAIRLPNNAFKKNAGTEVTTDLIFLQKLDDSDVASKATKDAAKAWMETSLIADPLGGEKIPLNDYFVAHPEMMLGRMERSGSMYRAASSALVAKEGADITAQLREAVSMLPAKVYVAPALAATSKAVNNAIVALEDATVQPGGMYTKDGALYVRLQNEAGEKLAQKLTPASQWTEKTVLGENRHERLMATADLRRTVRQLLAAEIKDDTTAMKQLRTQLNTQYDAIVKKWDFLSSKSTIQLLGDDPDYPLLAALETDYNKGIDAANAKKHGITAVKPSAKKMPIFTQRVIPMHEEVTHAETPVDALMVSIYERGHIDQQYISELLDGRDGKEIIDELVAQGHLFLDPEASHHVLKDEYLSGNVRRKIKIAQAAGLNENVRALEKVVPEDVPSHNIIGKMGASWISNEVYQDFINDMLGEGTESRVKYQPTAGSFIVEIKAGSEVANTNTLGIPVEGGRATDLIEKILNKKQAKIGSYDRDGKFHLDKESTDTASDKIIEIKTRFGDWLFKDAARSEVLTRAYNDTVNNYVVRRFDGAMLTFPGKVPDSIIKFRRHQRNAIARILQSGQALLDHVVGAGKTFTIVAAAMEMRRTGIAHKPMVTVPNHLVKQWAADFYRLYPGAKVLAATKNDFKRENRRAFMAKIATGDWDAVIIAHSTFGFIKPAPEFEIEFNGAQIKDITDAINELGGDPRKSDSRDKATKRTVKQLAKMREKLQEKIKALRQKPMDNLLDLAELGVDALFVDEAHKFKNLMFTTKMQGVRVGGDPTGSQRAYDMYVKTQQIMKKSGGRGVVFATGTPISNTMAEMYHMLRYLAPQTLTDMGLKTFDAWADSFASAETFWMQSMSGSGYKASTRLEKFVNVPSLLKIYDQVADTVTMEDIKDAYREENPGKEFPIPPVKGGGARTAVSIKRSQAQTDYMGEVAKRAKALEQRKGPPKKGEDNMLSIMGDARKAAMDIRLVDPSITERDPEGRIAVCAENVWQRYQQYNAVKGTQLIFSDMGTPKKTAGKEMDEYKALKERADKIDDLDLQDRATLGDEEAITILEDAEEAATEIDKKGKDWLDAIQTAMRGFSIYDDMKEALMEKGIPEHEIAFIHSYNTDDQKAALFKSVNSGVIRVLLGSTEKMGAGTNVQERAVALHHLDVPWRPSDVEQREGRVVRQGNKLLPVKGEEPTADWVEGFEVEIMAYATQDTLDLYMWQTQENKLKMIGQLRTGKVDIEMDNAFEEMEFSAGEMQAAATSNPYLLDEIRMRDKIKKLERQKRSHEGQINDIINRSAKARRDIENLPEEIKKAADIARGFESYEDGLKADDAALKMTVQGKEVTGKDNIRAALSDALDAMRDSVVVTIDGTGYPVKSQEQYAEAVKAALNKATGTPEKVTIDGGDFKIHLFGKLSSTATEALEKALDKTSAEKVKEAGFELNGKTYKSYSSLAEGFRVLTGDREAIKFSTGGQDIIQRSKIKNAVSVPLAKAVDGESREFLGKFGEIEAYVEAIPDPKDPGQIILNAQVARNGSVLNGDVLPAGVWNAAVEPAVAKLMGERVIDKALQLMRSSVWEEDDASKRLAKAKRTLADIESSTTNAAWPGESELIAARARYEVIMRQLSGRADANEPRNPVDDRAAKAERMAPLDSLLGNAANDGRIRPSDKAVYGMAAEGKSAQDILRFISASSRVPFYRMLAKALLQTGINPSITVGSSDGWKFSAGDGKYAAAYNPKTDAVALFRPAASERNVLHEMMHAATLKALSKKGLASAQMRALFNHVKAKGKLHGQYGMSNVDEFVAEAFTNPKFQQALKKIEAPAGSSLAGAWDWFVRVVRGILGLKTDSQDALSRAMEIGVGLMQENMKLSGEATGEARPAQGVVRKIDTPEFKNWFGGSKVVDAEGQPLVVYHGTGSRFYTFDGTGILSEMFGGPKANFFTSNKLLAEGYADDTEAPRSNRRIMGVYLSLQNPEVVERLVETLEEQNEIIAKAAAEGRDGVIFRKTKDYALSYYPEKPKVPPMWSAPKPSTKQWTEKKQDKGGSHSWSTEDGGYVRASENPRFPYSTVRPDGNETGSIVRYAKTLEDAKAVYENWDSAIENKPLPFSQKEMAEQESIETPDVFVAFSPTQIKSATRNTGAFDPANPDIRYNIASDWYDKTVPDTAKTMVANALTSDSSTSWVNALNTQYHKAQRWAAEGKPWFKQVFDLGQKFLSDTSRLSVVAQDAAPNLFREVKSLGDVKKAISGMKSLGDLTGSTHAKNIDAVANPLYEGTLDGGGNPMKGKVFSDDELISTYHLNDTQIKLYREALKAVGVSLDEMAKSIIAKHAKNLGLPFDNAMSLTDMAKDVAEQVESLRLEAENKKDVQAEKRLKKTLADVKGTASKTAMLKRAGYFPLMRFGKHTVTAIDDAGEVQFFSMYDGIPLVPNSGQYQANKVAAELRATNPEWKVTTGINNDEKYKLYAGMSVDSLQLFAEHMDAESLEPYQEYLRQATNNRSVMKRLIHRKGTPGFDRDVRRTLAQFIISNARAASSSYHLYDMRKAAESVPNEYGDIGKEAVRLFKYVSDPVEEAQGLRGFLFFNFLGGSLASAMVNMTQIPMVAFPFLSQYQDAAALGTTLAGAAKMAVKNPKNVQGPLGDALRRAEQDGVTAPQEIYQLAGVASGSALSGNRGFNLLLKTWGAPFALAEAFNRRTTFIAAYQIAEKMTPEQLRKAGAASAFEFAESAVTQTQFIYNKGNRPNAGRGAVGATLMTFKQFSIMYLELLNRLPRKQQLIMIGVLLLAAGGGGLPFAEDIEDLIDTIGQWLGYATNTKRALRNTLSSVIGERAADVAINGVASQMGIDIHSRIGLQNLAPGSAVLKKSSVNKGQDIQEFFGPAGSVVKSVGAALEALATGKPGQAALAMAPNAAQNAIRGARMIASGYAEDAGGRRTIPVSPAEGAAKAIGFNPKSVADFGTVKRDISQNQRLIQVKREEFTSAMVDAILSGDNEARKQAMVDMMQWNRDNDPSMRVIVDQAAVLRRVQQARMDGISRFTKTVSKPMRESARQELMR